MTKQQRWFADNVGKTVEIVLDDASEFYAKIIAADHDAFVADWGDGETKVRYSEIGSVRLAD